MGTGLNDMKFNVYRVSTRLASFAAMVLGKRWDLLRSTQATS